MKINSHKEMRVWQDAMDGAMQVFEVTRTFPADERFSLVDQIRRASRSVAANLAEAWRRRRYEAAFLNKLNEAECEASETQTWIELASRCRYISPRIARDLDTRYERILGQLVKMISNPKPWIIKPSDRRGKEEGRRGGGEKGSGGMT
ncbi:MAG TPA: four helix bundle protein [Pirellulales bacterium]|nr:four helix bundle protein [Pirellulales bacterium]